MSKCGGCPADVLWVVTPLGKPMPIDPEPVENGNLVLVRGNPNTVRPPELTDDPAGDRFVSHFATCPMSKEYRKR